MARKDDRLDDELAFHLEQQTAKLMRAGVPEVEARRQARLKLGGVQQVREVLDGARAPASAMASAADTQPSIEA